MALYLHRFQGKCAAGDQFTYGWHANSLRDLATAQAAAVAWNATVWNGAAAGNGYRDHVTADVSMLNVITTTIDPFTGKQLARADTAQVIAGVAGGNSMGADVALCVSLRTSLPQRRGRGRFYLPQPAASQLTTQGRVLPDLINDLIDSLTSAWTTYDSGTDRPVLYGPTDRIIRNIVSFDIGDLYDTQRRRENKVTEARTTHVMP